MHYNNISEVETWGSKSFLNIAIKRVKGKKDKTLEKAKGFSLAGYIKVLISGISHIQKKRLHGECH